MGNRRHCRRVESSEGDSKLSYSDEFFNHPGPSASGSRAETARVKPDGVLYAVLALPLLALSLLALSACASISEEECLAADWYSIGVEDGAKGYPITRIGNYRKDCAEVGVAPDAEQYQAGRLVGLDSFCTYDRGYAEGKRGARNRSVCPPGPLAEEFAQGYDAGHYVYEVNRNIRNLEHNLADVRDEIAQIRTDLDNGYRTDSSGKKQTLNKYERDALYERLLALGKEEGRLEGELAALRSSIAGS
jgi:hypothetical protein